MVLYSGILAGKIRNDKQIKETMKMSRVIGIDLGTTNSCVSVVENDVPVIIPSATGATTTPSIVAFTKNGERLTGEAAARQAVTNPERTITSVKRHMGSDWSARIDGKEYKPQTISAMILMQLKKDAEKFLGEEVTEAVITVPAYFNDIQRQATKDAGRIAGLNVSYGLNHGEPQKVMVYDLGGGTFDVSIIEIGEGIIEVLATSGNNHLGGDDFDERLVQGIVRKFKDKTRVDLTKDFAAMQRIREAAERAKKELSTSDTTHIMQPFITQVKGEALHLDMVITRQEFESMISDLIQKTEDPVRNALNDAHISPAQLGRVLLVGGSTRVPAVQRKVREMTGKEPSRNINPDECVAKGAAILGSTLQGRGLVAAGTGQDLLLLDVTPLSLSIETVGGVATRIVQRNTTLPARYSQIFSTAAPYQRNVDIHVLQGERPMARDNKTIGKFRLKGIKPAPAGVPQIEVTFDIDANGILKVSARDLDTGREQSITITADDRMSDMEIQQAMQDAQNYASQDQVRKDAIELLGDANKLLIRTERCVKNAGKQLEKAVKKQVKADTAKLQKLVAKCRLDRVDANQLSEIRAAKEQLEQSAGDILMRYDGGQQ